MYLDWRAQLSVHWQRPLGCDQSAAQAKDPTYLERLHGEQASMNFTLRQTKLYYHLLKGERLYRAWKSRHEQEAGLGALVELALARYARSCQEKFMATAGMKAFPMIPGMQSLEARATELSEAITTDPKSVAGVNISGFAINRIDEQLMESITGYIAAGPSGSRAVLWTDVPSSRFALRAEGPTLSWFDECGRPIRSHALDCFTSAVVVEAEGMPVDKLFSALLKGSTDSPESTVSARAQRTGPFEAGLLHELQKYIAKPSFRSLETSET